MTTAVFRQKARPSQVTGHSIAESPLRHGLLGQRPGMVCGIAAAVVMSLLVSGAAFGGMLGAVRGDGWNGTALDLALSDLAVQHRDRWITGFMRQVTDLGSTVALASVAFSTIALTLLLRRYRLALVMSLAAVGSSVLTVSMKSIIARPRPETNGDIIRASDFSFPSGHTLESVAIYGALVFIAGSLLMTRRARVTVWFAGTVLAAAIGVSRVYLGVHWASDVAAGWLLGLILLAAVAGLLMLDERLARGLSAEGRAATSRIRNLGARTSVFGIVGMTALTAFLAGSRLSL